MGRRTPKNPYGLDLGFLAIAKQLDAYQYIAGAAAKQMAILDEPLRLISGLLSSPAYEAAVQAHRIAVATMTPPALTSLANSQRAIAASMLSANALAGLEESLRQSFAPYNDLAVEAARRFAATGLQIDSSRLHELLLGALPAFLAELTPTSAESTEVQRADQTADDNVAALRESLVSYAPVVFWLALLLWVSWIAGTVVGADLGEGHSTDAMRDSMVSIASLIVLADKVRSHPPPS
jgi:hypothetical protein